MIKKEKISKLLDDIDYELRKDNELEDMIREGLEKVIDRINEIKKYQRNWKNPRN